MREVSKERLAVLRFRAEHGGFTKQQVEKAIAEKTFNPKSTLGVMIEVTPGELRAFLDAYDGDD